MASSVTGAAARRHLSTTSGQSSTGGMSSTRKTRSRLASAATVEEAPSSRTTGEISSRGEVVNSRGDSYGAGGSPSRVLLCRALAPEGRGVRKHRRQGARESTPAPFFGRIRTLSRPPRKNQVARGEGALLDRGGVEATDLPRYLLAKKSERGGPSLRNGGWRGGGAGCHRRDRGTRIYPASFPRVRLNRIRGAPR